MYFVIFVKESWYNSVKHKHEFEKEETIENFWKKEILLNESQLKAVNYRKQHIAFKRPISVHSDLF